MARFLGKMHGARQTITRLGHSSMTVEACSWHGKVVLTLTRDGDRDMYSVEQRHHEGKGINETIAEGVVGEKYVPPSAGTSAVRYYTPEEIRCSEWPKGARFVLAPS